MIRDYREPLWPRWAVSPRGARAMFHGLGDIPSGWKIETPLPSEADTVALLGEELAALREEYRVAMGSEPNREWDARTIRNALSGGNTPPPPGVDEEYADLLRSRIPLTNEPERLQEAAARLVGKT